MSDHDVKSPGVKSLFITLLYTLPSSKFAAPEAGVVNNVFLRLLKPPDP